MLRFSHVIVVIIIVLVIADILPHVTASITAQPLNVFVIVVAATPYLCCLIYTSILGVLFIFVVVAQRQIFVRLLFWVLLHAFIRFHLVCA